MRGGESMEKKEGIFDRSITPKTFKANVILFVISEIYLWGGFGHYLIFLGWFAVVVIQIAFTGVSIVSFFGSIDTALRKIFRQK